MNKKNKVYNSQENKDHQTLSQITPVAAAAALGIAANIEQVVGGSYESLNQCDTFGALIFESKSIPAIQRQILPGLPVKRLNHTTWAWEGAGSYCGSNIAPKSSPISSSKPGLYETTIRIERRAIRLSQPTLSFRSVASRKTISQQHQQPVILMLLYLLSFHIVAHITLGNLFYGTSLLSSAHNVPDATSKDSGPISRPIRMAKLLTDERSNEILVRTLRHGLFKGYILPPPGRWHRTRTLPHGVGEINDASVVGFFGIRYASAPIRRLRFMPPTAYHYAPNQVHDMQHFGPICRQRFPFDFGHLSDLIRRNSGSEIVQPGSKSSGGHQHPLVKELLDLASGSGLSSGLELQMHFMRRMMPKESFSSLRPLFKQLASREESEDCLNLNIYVPIEAIPSTSPGLQQQQQQQQQQGQLKPVLVIIHGESFDFGAGSTINGQKFVQQTRLITITFNFRLNILGFPPKLAGASRGNLGLMDQVAALHWIKDNIGSFGGSPNNITLMGTKRGAIFVNLLMLSPLAKGLFQRAIMEDGSALTPIVANHIISPLGSNVPPLPLNPLTASSSPSLPAIQHVRFLAKLCDCPVYHRHQQQQQSQPTKVLAPTTSNGSSGHQFNAATSGSADSQQQQQQHQLLSSVADEIKANALTFECLRHKPIEQLMQPVPLNLLQFNQATGEVSIPTRWLGPLAVAETGHQVESSSFGLAGDQDRQPTKSPPPPPATQQQQSSEELTQVDARMINKLILLAAKEQIEKGLGEAPGGGNRSSGEAARLNELLGAIYAPPSTSVRPLFGPIEDGTIVLEEDIAVGMLKNGSTFVQRDLLIGLSKPVISSPTLLEQSSPSSYDKTRVEIKPDMDTITSATTFELGPDHIMANRFYAYTQQVGLTSEQAVSLVNLFVRSFYRYHNQEITNSIINHYLSDNRILRARKLSSLRAGTTSRANGNKAHDADSIDAREAEMTQQQLVVLDSLLEAFQDALTNVPVLKTCLIHAVKQLEYLVDAFVGQQFEKWRQGQASTRGQAASLAQSDSQIQANLNETLYTFTSFATSLLNDTNWPLELHSPSNLIVQQPKSTYVYQFDANTLIRRIKRLSSELASESLVSFGWKSLKERLDRLISRLQSDDRFSKKFGFECIMQVDFDDGDDDGYTTSDEDASGQFIFDRLNDWLCSRYSKILKSFISFGNVNHLVPDEEFRGSTEDIIVTPISERVARFDSQCPEYDQPQQTTSGGDHHSVQIAQQGSEIHQGNTNISSGACRRELNSMVLDHVLSEFKPAQSNDEARNSRGQFDWPVFNIFTQQVATLPGPKSLLHVGPIVDVEWSGQYDQKSTFSARSSFWANYVPALNCTRTQPVIPASLLSSSSITNSHTNSSYLLNLKLLFSCQHGGKTSYEVFESLISSIKQQLLARITQWRLATLMSGGEHNHHSLRMANNTGLTSSPDENLPENQQDHLNVDSNGNQSQNDSGSSPPNGSIEANNSGEAIRARTTMEMRTKYVGILMSVCALIFSITLASGACAVIRRKRDQSRRQQQQQAKLVDTQISLADKENLDGQVDDSLERVGKVEDLVVGGNNNTSGLQMVAKDQQQQQQEVIPVAINESGPPPRVNSSQNHSIDYHVDGSPAAVSLMQNQFCTLDNQIDGYIYWGDNMSGAQQGDILMNGSIPLCRSHSLLDVVPINGLQSALATNSSNNNHLAASATQHIPSPPGQSTSSNQEPIMMPILSGSKTISHHHHHQTQSASSSASLRRAGCLTNHHSTTIINGAGQLHGDSSSETQDNSKLSILKKRVKISDPLGTARQGTSLHQSSTSGRQKGNKTTSASQMRFNDPLYCPVHHDQAVAAATNSSLGSVLDDGYSHHSWNGGGSGQIDLIESNNNNHHHHYLNCDHQFITDFTGSSQPQNYKYITPVQNYGSDSGQMMMMEGNGGYQPAAAAGSVAYSHHNHLPSSYQGQQWSINNNNTNNFK